MAGLSIIPIFENLGVLAICALVHMRICSGGFAGSDGHRQVLLGIGFGLSAAMTMCAPVELAPGHIFDARSAPILLAGPYGGVLSASLATAIAVIARFWIGGAGAVPGMVGIIILGAGSIAIRSWMRLQGHNQLSLIRSGLTCLFPLVLSTAPVFLLIPNWEFIIFIFTQGVPHLIIGSMLGVLLLTSLFNWDAQRRQLMQDLATSEQKARDAVAAKDRFIASISHEIRTPMNSVVGYVDLLTNEALDTEQRVYINRARNGLQSLSRIIDELLSFSKIQATGVELSPEPTNLREELKDTIDNLRILAEEKGLGFADRVEPSLPQFVSIDRMRLRQLITNVVGNAVKYTDAGNIFFDVTTRWSESGEPLLSLAVKDTGMGMSKETLGHLFDPFERGQGSIGREGTGLGMAITKTIVTAMGGQVDVQSREGFGTCVALSIPIVAVADDEVVESDRAFADSPGDDPLLPPMTILVAEDVRLNSDLLEAVLTKKGHIVTTAENGEVARTAVERRRDTGLAPFDAIIMDVQMPVLDGIAATRRIRTLDGSHGATPIIGLSAFATSRDRKICLSAGMSDYLTKPINQRALTACLSRIVDSRAARSGGGAPRGPAAPADLTKSIDFSRLSGIHQELGAQRTQEFVEQIWEDLEGKLRILSSQSTSRQEAAEIVHDMINSAGLLGLDGVATEARTILNRLRASKTSPNVPELHARYLAWGAVLQSCRNDIMAMAAKPLAAD